VDAQYEDARTSFKSFTIESAKMVAQAKAICKYIEDFSRAALKVSTDVSTWMNTNEGDAAAEYRAQGATALASAQFLQAESTDVLLSRIDRNFTAGLAEHDARVAECRKIKAARKSAVDDYDKFRELHRQAETAKKPKPDQIEKARLKSEEAKTRYEQTNAQFLEAVFQLGQDRKRLLGDRLKAVLAIYFQFLTKVSPTSGELPALVVPPAAVPAPAPKPAATGEATPQPGPPAQSEAPDAAPERKAEPAVASAAAAAVVGFAAELPPPTEAEAARPRASGEGGRSRSSTQAPRKAQAWSLHLEDEHGMSDGEDAAPAEPAKPNAAAQAFEKLFMKDETQGHGAAPLPAVYEEPEYGDNPFD
jgi:hypothetical protein